jgi:hypothetical protein
MGGNALKNTFTRRYTLQEFKDLQGEVYLKLLELINTHPKFCNDDQMLNLPIAFIPYYENKESFGDMDILLNMSYYNYKVEGFQEKLKKVFGYNELFRNTNVWSFDYKELQIDLIFVQQHEFRTTIYYYAWNDLGNMMGRIANKFGTRYGSYGLSYKIKSRISGNYFSKKVFLSKDLPKIFRFLGYDYDRYMKGFKTIDEIFEYAISTKYFNPEVFQFQNLKQEDRTRNKKRNLYNKFLAYIEKNKNTFNMVYTFKPQEQYFDYINSFFPEAELTKVREQLEAEERKFRMISERFNGNIVKEAIRELASKEQGKNLGKFMEWFKGLYYSKEAFETTILENDIEFVKEHLKNSYNVYKEKKKEIKCI